jgi:lysozyme family protein
MTASNYAACIAKVLRYEGGYVNNPKDPGGPTNHGITLATARANGYTGDMHAIPLDLVHRIYKAKYWDAVNGDALPAGLDLAVFDYAVNSGVSRAKAALAAVGDGAPRDRIHRYCGARLAFLHGLRTWPTFGKGWSSRVADVEATALKMIAAPIAEAPGEPMKLPVPTNVPTTKQDAKEVGWLGGVTAAVTGAMYGLWGNWAFRAALFVLVAAALYWFLVRPLLRRVTALGDIEADFTTRIRLALKGVKTLLWSRLLTIAGIALPLLTSVNGLDLSDYLPDIAGIPGSTYQYGILAAIGWITNKLRQATTTPVGQTDLAIAPAIEAPSIVPAPDAEPPLPEFLMPRRPRPAKKASKVKRRKVRA